MDASTVPTDRGHLEVLTLDECYELLASVPVGRVAFVRAGEPIVLPVNHTLDGRTVVFRTSYGSKLDAAWWKVPATFEVDGYDETRRRGWSVVVKGLADLVVRDDECARLDALGLRPWARLAAESGDWVRIEPTEVTGRRIVAAR